MDADGATDIRALDALYTALVPVRVSVAEPVRHDSVHTHVPYANDEAVIAIGSR